MFVIYETYERLQPRKRAQTTPVASFGLYVNILFSSFVFFDTNLCLIAHTAFNLQDLRQKQKAAATTPTRKGPNEATRLV